jgi:hypothetical protein
MDRVDIKSLLGSVVPNVPIMTLDMGTKCTLLCADCMRTGNRFNNIPPGGYGRDMTTSDFKKVLKYYDRFTFNGQLSDPIFNPHIKTMLTMMKETIPQDQMHLSSFHTAATAKHLKEEYYIKLFEANPHIRWIFGIDGLPGESEQYRKNQDSEFLFWIMTLAAEMGIPTTWQYIVFSFNEASISKAKQIAKSFNITLELVETSRWNGEDDPRRPNRFKGKYLDWSFSNVKT